ncbi:DUF4351 domain-containing protein [candidate division KSB1 bacterium]|nr:DUF4351 domain-containing protein [candidate division KSB1 bacterium]
MERSHYAATLKLSHHFDGHTGLAFQPIIVVMRQIKVTELERLDDVGLIPLYPLCKISSREIEASIPVWAERIKRADKTVAERSGLLTLLGNFATHRVTRLTLKKFNQLVGGFKMEDTQIGKDLIRIGVLKGIPQGMQRLLLRQIAQRFGTVPVAIRHRLEKITDAKLLEHIAEGLLEANNLKQFQQLVEPNGKSASHKRNGLKKKGTAKLQHALSRQAD